MAANTSGTSTAVDLSGDQTKSLKPVKSSSTDGEQFMSKLLNARPVHSTKATSLLTYTMRSGIGAGNASRVTVSSESRTTNSGLGDFAGFKHLLVMILALGNLRVVAFDFQTFGFLATLKQLGIVPSDLYRAFLAFSVTTLLMPLALFIEKLLSRTKITEHRSLLREAGLHLFVAFAGFLGVSFYCYTEIWHPLIGTCVESNTIVVFLKLISYGLTNRDLRAARDLEVPIPELYNKQPYPTNLTLGNTMYFWLAPTLCYQPSYPVLPKRRWMLILRLTGEITTAVFAIWLLGIQFAGPILEKCLQDYTTGQYWMLADHFSSLVCANIIIWITGFFLIFQSFLNWLAEITRFADREFYKDWWNAGCVGTFWRDWNKPVSNFFRRHLYVPICKKNVSRFWASAVVFLISAVLHEILVGVATKNFNGVAFLAMIGQIPLIMVTDPLEKLRGRGTTIGNCVLWLSIFLGMPTAVIIYYLAWNLKHPAL